MHFYWCREDSNEWYYGSLPKKDFKPTFCSIRHVACFHSVLNSAKQWGQLSAVLKRQVSEGSRVANEETSSQLYPCLSYGIHNIWCISCCICSRRKCYFSVQVRRFSESALPIYYRGVCAGSGKVHVKVGQPGMLSTCWSQGAGICLQCIKTAWYKWWWKQESTGFSVRSVSVPNSASDFLDEF